MASRIDVTGPVGAGIARTLADLILEAREILSGPDHIREAVHEARKTFKEVRSHLRLLRPAIGDDYDTLNATVGALARHLADARDGQALHDALDLVEPRLDGKASGAVALMRKGADQELAMSANEEEIRAAAAKVADVAGDCVRIIRSWSLDDGPKVYLKGLQDSYRTARSRFRQAMETRIPDDLHTACKRIVNLRYQFDLLRDIRPAPMRRQVRRLQELRETLGRHNDLVLLQNRVEGPSHESWRLNEAGEILDIITVLRADCVNEAAERGAKLFNDKPKAQVEKMEIWWEESRK